jgi:lipopolysaccharide transport system ATP-binding protein
VAEIAIKAQGVGKLFRIPSRQEAYDTLRDSFVRWVKSFLRTGHRKVLTEDTVWALKDVSFEVKPGEIVGIIGRNGAGKSTLLKVLSRITRPTTGVVEIHGRAGSLLEVGTGFHNELTGRENIFLNGAILGMGKREIDRKFDEIVDFGEVGKFIDTPVKHYSSGMYLRLGFAVAAHLEPDILIVDEVLAVGDARFQKKCLNKMQDVGKEGRTVLFVSHNMQAITRLCPRAILLDDGKILVDGPADKVVSAYLNSGFGTMAWRDWPEPTKAPGRETARLRSVRTRTEDGRVTEAMDIRRSIFIEMEYDVLKPGHILLPYYDVSNEAGVDVFSTVDLDPVWRHRPRPAGRWVSTVHIPGNLLSEGMHYVAAGLLVLNPMVHEFHAPEAIAFQVIDSLEGNSARGDWGGNLKGAIRPLLNWRSQLASGENRAGKASSQLLKFLTAGGS